MKIVPGLDFNITFDGVRRPLAYREYAAYAARVYGRGADGVYIFNPFDLPAKGGVRQQLIDRGLDPTDVRRLSEGVRIPPDFD